MVNVTELWRPVPGYEGGYEASDLGRVRSVDRWVTQTNGLGTSYSRLMRGKFMAPCPKDNGYLNISLGFKNSKMLHCVIALTWIGPRPEGFHVNHKNGDKSDNRACNLGYVTPKENALHAHMTGLSIPKCGPERPQLTIDEVRRIRSFERDVATASIARGMNLPYTTVSRARRGITFSGAV